MVEKRKSLSEAKEHGGPKIWDSWCRDLDARLESLLQSERLRPDVAMRHKNSGVETR